MSAILKQLYDDDIFPAEQFYPKTEEYKAIRKKHFSHYEDFTKKMEAFSPELSKEFVEIMDEQHDTVPPWNSPKCSLKVSAWVPEW